MVKTLKIWKSKLLDNITKNSVLDFIKEKWLLIGFPFLYVIIYVNPIAEEIAIFPDWLNLSNVDPQDYFRLIIGSIASIFGIVMAVVLLTVEFFKERLNENLHLNLLNNHLIRNSIYSSITLISLSFIGYLQLDDFNNSSNLTIGYYVGIIFLAYIYSVYPVLREIIGKSSRIKTNIDLVDNVDIYSFRGVSRYRRDNEELNDRLKTLKNEIDDYILSHNILAYEKLNNDILEKAITLMADGEDRETCDIIVTGLVWLWRENSKTAIRVKDAQFFELIWNYTKDIYVHFSVIKAPLWHLQDLDFFISFDFLKLNFKLENSIPLSTALDCIEVSFRSNLINNCPSENDLKRLIRMYEGGSFEETAHQITFQWEHINGIFQLLTSIQKTAIAFGDKDLFEESSRRIETICSEINFNISNIGNYQKGSITWHMLSYSFLNSHEALLSGLYHNTLDCFNIPNHLIERIIENDQLHIKDIRIIIRTIADYLILAFKEDKLFMDGHYGTLYDFCLIGIHSLKQYRTNVKARKTVKYIINVLKHLKELSEENLSAINPNDYLVLKSRIKHFMDVAIKIDGFEEEEKPVRKWKKIYESFHDISEVKNFGIVKW